MIGRVFHCDGATILIGVLQSAIVLSLFPGNMYCQLKTPSSIAFHLDECEPFWLCCQM